MNEKRLTLALLQLSFLSKCCFFCLSRWCVPKEKVWTTVPGDDCRWFDRPQRACIQVRRSLNLVWRVREHRQDITDGFILCTKCTSNSAVGWILWGLCVRHLQTHSWSTTSTFIAKRLCQCHWLWLVYSSFITVKKVIKEDVKSRFQYADFIVSMTLSLSNRVGVKLLVAMLKKNAKNLSH